MPAPSEVSVSADARFAARKALSALDVAVSMGVEAARLQIDSAVEELAAALQAQGGALRFHVGPNVVATDGQVIHVCSGQAGNVAGRLFAAGIRQFQIEAGASEKALRTLAETWVRIDDSVALAAALQHVEAGQCLRVDPWFEQQRRGARAFLGPFRAILADIVPGVVGSPPPDHQFRDTELLPGSVSRAEAAVQAATQDAVAGFEQLRAVVAGWPSQRAAEHLIELLCRIALRAGAPVDATTMAQLIAAATGLLLEAGAWTAHAAAVRGLHGLAEAAETRPGREAESALFWDAAVGPAAVRVVAQHIARAPEDYARWARWYFFQAGKLDRERLLEAFVGVESPGGRAFLRDLMSWLGQPKPDWWLDHLADDRPEVVTEALVALQRVELSARQRERMGAALQHPRATTRLLALRLIGRSVTTEMRAHFVDRLLDDDPRVRHAMLARLVHLGDPRGANAIVAAIRSTHFIDLPEHEQRRLFVGLARLGGDRFIRAFRDILKLDEGGRGLSRLFRREAIADDPLRRAAVHGLAALGTADAVASLEQVAKRGARTLAMLAEQLLEAATSGQLRREELVSEAPATLAPLAERPDEAPPEQWLAVERLFEPSAFGLAPSASLERLLRGYLGAPSVEVTAEPEVDTPTPPPALDVDAPLDPVEVAEIAGLQALVEAETEGPESLGLLDQLGEAPPAETDAPSPLDVLMSRTAEPDPLPDFARSTLPLEPIQLARPGEPIDLESASLTGPLDASALDGSEAFPSEDTGGGATPPPLGPPTETREADGLFGPAGATVAPPQPTPVPEFGGVAPELSMLLDDLGPATPPPEGGLLSLAALDTTGAPERDPAEPAGAEAAPGVAAAGGRMATPPVRDEQDLSAGPPPLKVALESTEERLPDVQSTAPEKATTNSALDSLLGSLFQEDE